MDIASLERRESTAQGTIGVFRLGKLKFFTAELPWRENDPDLSCIPTGIYRCVWSWSHHLYRFGYEVTYVSGRSGIRIHPANLMGDVTQGFKAELKGCIALGEKVGFINGQRALMLSKLAVGRFEDAMAGQSFGLAISNASTLQFG